MHKMNDLRRIDLNLLVILDALLSENDNTANPESITSSRAL